jgi:hypothetical protein
MSDACTHWIALSDRQALDETLSAADRTFLTAHAAQCPACGAERAVFSDLASLIDAAPHAHDAAAAAPAETQAHRTAGGARRRLGWAVAAAAASLALGLGLWQYAQREPERGTPGVLAARSPAPAIRISLTSGGDVEVDGRPAQPGASIALGSLLFARSGATCLQVDEGIRACMAQGGVLRVAELSETSRRLELRAGKLAASLEPQRAGRSFGIVTREGSAIAVGTAFSVEVPPDGGPVVTRVLHGTVLVRSASGAEQPVGAHRFAAMQGPARQLSERDEARERPLLEQAASAPRARPGSLRIESQPAGAEVLVDGRSVGVTPLGLLVDPGEHTLLVGAAQDRSWREQVRVSEGEQLVRSFGDPAPAAAMAPAVTSLRSREGGRATTEARVRARARQRSAGASEGDSAAALLSAARELHARRDREGALRVYRALFARPGESAEALAARVPYGEMLLAPGGDSSSALAAFEDYLARGGALTREASFGRVRALRALGRLDDERAALDAFLRSFPDGPLADAVRARQRALSQP